MPLPTSNDLHVVDQVLSDYAIGYGQDRAKFFAAFKAATNKSVDDQSDRYIKWDKGDWFRSEAALRADGTPSKEGGMRMSSEQYFADVYAIKTRVTKRQATRASRRGIDIERVKTRWIVEQLHLKRDILFQAAAFAGSIWANTDQTGVSGTPSTNEFKQWDASGSTPLEDLLTYIDQGRTVIGRPYNTLVISPLVWNALRIHDDLTDLFKYTTGGLPNEAKLAETLGLDNVVIAGAIQNTANEEATDVIASVYGKHALLMQIDQSPSEEVPTALTAFSWSDFDGMTPEGAQINSWYDDETQSTILEGEMCVDFKVTSSDAGLYLASAIG